MALEMLTQSELVEAIEDKTGHSKSEIRVVLMALTEVVAEEISHARRVKVANVTIEPKLKKASKKRKGRNPATGEEVVISAKPASVKVKARVGKALQESAPSVKKLQKATA